MSITERDYSLVVNGLQDSNLKKETLDLMRRIVDLGCPGQLVVALIGTQSGPDQDQAISRTMANFEKVAETDRSLACILMSELWGAASQATMHDICNSIDYWIWETDSVELQCHLKELASSEMDPLDRRHFQRLAERKPD